MKISAHNSTTPKKANAALGGKSYALRKAVQEIKPYEKPDSFSRTELKNSKGHIIRGYRGTYPEGSVSIEFHHVDGRWGKHYFMTEWNPRGPLDVDIFLDALKTHVFKA